MDGAAARGRLGIMQWLHSTRSEGCSVDAFTEAAANGHLHVLRWLIQHYPQLSRPVHCLVAAAEHGHVEILRFLRPRVSWFEATPAVEAAAAIGQVRSLEMLLPARTARAFITAAANGRVEVLQFFMDRRDACSSGEHSLKKAARFGHIDAIKLLLPTCDRVDASHALRSAAKWGRAVVAQLLLERVSFRKAEVAHALQKAVDHEQYEVANMLIESFPGDAEKDADWISTDDDDLLFEHRQIFQSFINVALRSAAKRGTIEMVEMLLERFPLARIGPALQVAAENRQYAVVELLLRSCEAKHDSSVFTTIGMAAKAAAACGDAKMARLLIKKATLHSAGRALNIAVSRNDLVMVNVFASTRGEYYKTDAYKVDALVRAAKDKQMEVWRL
ncbi:hypothetical protein PHYPSEUDO_002745 [Phytophthora pseudosyringae]|uniref:Uncharacterized protein n=1 Tax=Phytophthora pseudosyringae TaxID=221518 RepID=A0A8T1VVS4_9STRA|nr:hypothetical protein PHYPSEUDO_002745 [Phytophthora pseudosyringae]